MTDSVTISAEEYRQLLNARQDLEDARQVAASMAEIASGAPTFTEEELDAYLAAATPLAYWRKRAGMTQAQLAAQTGITQGFLAQLETGKRDASIAVLRRIATILDVRLGDLASE